MSKVPPPPIDPLPYYTPHFQPSRRPLSVSIIGWAAAIFGGIGLLGGFCIVIQHQFLSALQPSNPVTDIFNTPGAIRNYITVFQIVGWFVNALLLIAGIGCLKLKPSARRLMNGYALYQLLSVAVGVIFYVEMINPEFSRLAAQHPNDPAIQGGYHFSIIAQVIGIVIGTGSGIAILYFLNRPHVKAAFEPPPPPPLPLPPPPP
ncbi:MAG TPA: hypothetical protein VHX86_14890 [Tepidisphaeraceae bacterium]|nr:hypothetical protein [Tepidisphaeraceae bacterium]